MDGISSEPNPLGSCPVQTMASKMPAAENKLQHPRVKIPSSASAVLLEAIHSSDITTEAGERPPSPQRNGSSNLLRKTRRDDPERVKAVTQALHRSLLITAEIKTNVIIRNECRVLQGLSSYLSTAYSQPEESISVSMSHSDCMLFQNSLKAACIVTIHALPFNLKATANAKIIPPLSKYLTSLIRVKPERIAIRFVAVDEHMFGMYGLTVPEMVEKALNSDLGYNLKTNKATESQQVDPFTTQNANDANEANRNTSNANEHVGVDSSGGSPEDPVPEKKIHRKKSFLSALFCRNKTGANVPGSN